MYSQVDFLGIALALLRKKILGTAHQQGLSIPTPTLLATCPMPLSTLLFLIVELRTQIEQLLARFLQCSFMNSLALLRFPCIYMYVLFVLFLVGLYLCTFVLFPAGLYV